MARESGQLQRFLYQVHRRLVVLRILESDGEGVLVGCGIGVRLLPILLWRGQSGLGLVLMLLGTFMLLAVIWRLLHWPRIVDASIEADRQLDTADLLTTAWLLTKGEEA